MFLPGIKTDHRSILITIVDKRQERGRGYWKINNSLLTNTKLKEQVNMEIRATVQSSINKDAKTTWETIKSRVKRCVTKFARENASENNLVIGQLAEKITDFESRLPLIESESKIYEATKEDFNDKITQKTNGLMFRSKCRWISDGEKNSKYFYALEKSNYNAKTCYAIFDPNNPDQLLETQEQIIDKQKIFYQELYAKDQNINFDLINTHNIFVNDIDRLRQDSMLTLQELKDAVFAIAKNKTPGKDGLTADFYQVFWDELSVPFLNMVNQSYSDNKLHQTALQGVLNLIPKQNKDSRHIKNLRPITLLNTDYKIIEKAIAAKIMPSLYYLTNHNQRGSMPERRISVNIRKLLDIIFYAIENELEILIVSLDFAKCFDRVSFDILHGALKYFKFGEVVKNWTKILYKDFQVQVQNNEKFSDAIYVQKGIHQGGGVAQVYTS